MRIRLTTLMVLLLCWAPWSVAQTMNNASPAAGSASSQSATAPGGQAVPTTPNSNASSPMPSGDSNSLQSQIENAIRNEPTLGSSHIDIRVNPGSIDLSGTVGSSKDKQTAERIAQSFDGNRKLNDSLVVTGHGHSDMAPEHSAMNNGGTGNASNPAMQGRAASNSTSTQPQHR